jgi:hypothetical protein
LNWYKKAQFDMLGQMIGSYFMDESQLENLMIFVTNKQISPQTVQSYVEQMETQLFNRDPQMFEDKKSRLFNAINGVNYNPTVEDVTAPIDQQAPQQEMNDAGQGDFQNTGGVEGEIQG